MKAVGVLFLLMFMLSGVANAQGDSSCVVADLSPSIPQLLNQLGVMQTAVASGNLSTSLQALSDLRAAVNTLDAKCAGLSFAGNGNEVVGVFELPEGIYRAHGDFATFALVTLEQISGDCGLPFGESSPLLTTPVASGGAAEGLVRSKGCQAMLQLVTMGGDWSITFERIDA